jgi:hypothetical protein
VVWHHRRNSVKAYFRQQIGYGRAEALLERKWPEKYNALGHVSWTGRLYGRGLFQAVFGRPVIYQGRWGTAPFQSIYQPPIGTLDEVPQTPEWYLLTIALAVLALMGFKWSPLNLFQPIFLLALLPLVAQAVRGAAGASFPDECRKGQRLWLHALTAFLYFAQPMARLWGRMKHGLTPWRRRGVAEFSLPTPGLLTIWSESWHSSHEWLGWLATLLESRGAVSVNGGEFDSWDLEIRGGLFGSVRTRMAIEEHGSGKQLIRFRSWPTVSVLGLSCLGLLAMSGSFAGFHHEFVPAGILGGGGAGLALWMLRECSSAKASILDALDELRQKFV